MLCILIHRLDEAGNRVETFNYQKTDPARLELVTEFIKLVGPKPTIYTTGLGAIEQQKRLAKALEKFGKFELERVPMQQARLTASGPWTNGAIAPKNVRGG